MSLVAVQGWMGVVDLCHILDLMPEGFLLSAQYPSLIEGEAVACVK